MPYVGWPWLDLNAARRGVAEFKLEDGNTLLWPRCEITDCPNGVCVHMSKSLCYVHGIEFKVFTEEEFEANRKAQT